MYNVRKYSLFQINADLFSILKKKITIKLSETVFNTENNTIFFLKQQN